MRRMLAALAACLLLAPVLASCSSRPGTTVGGSASGASGRGAVHVDLDTPQLRSLKAAAGVAPCRPGTASNQLPAVRLRCLGGGRSVALDELRGPLVVNLWAQWCGPCRTELPFYQELHRKGRGIVRVLGVDYLDTQPEAALRLVQQTGVTYPLVADPGGELRADLRVRGLPGIAFVAADGSVSTEFQSVRSYAELRDLVQQHLHVKLPA